MDFHYGTDTSFIDDLVLISELSKWSKLYHFNVLKSSFCFIINIWQKFKSSVSVFKPSQCSQCCRGAIYCFSLTSKSMILIYERDNFFKAT